MNEIETKLFSLHQRGVCSFLAPERRFQIPPFDKTSTFLISGRKAQEFSRLHAKEILQQIIRPEFDELLRNYFLGNWNILGVQSICSIPNSPPQKFHRDHKLGPRVCLVWAMSLDAEVLIDTRFCPSSHKNHKRPITKNFTSLYPPISIDTSGVLYDSAIVHAGKSSKMACSSKRIFISFSSELISDSEHTEIIKFNGIQTPLFFSARDILK